MTTATTASATPLRLLRAAALTLLSAGLIAAATAHAKPKALVRDSIPEQYKWDFTDIYADWNAWEQGLAQMKAKMDAYGALKGTLADGPEALVRAYQLNDSIGLLSYKVYRYPALMNTVDTRDQEVLARLQQVQIAFAEFGTATAWFQPELLSIPWETMSAWLESTPALAPYRHGIEDSYRQQEHVLSEDKEELLSYFARFGSTPVETYQHLSTSDITWPTVTLTDGTELLMTEGNYYHLVSTNRNQADRRLAFEAYYPLYDDLANTYAGIYNGILQRNWASAQARRYRSCLEAALDSYNVPVDVYHNLVTEVGNGIDPIHRYHELRKRILGNETYHNYDGSIPLVDFDKVYEYDDIVPWVIESVAPLGKEYQDKMRTALEGRWVDVYENEGKVSGAFSANVYGVHPYMLMNFTGVLRDVFTLAHEAGHTLHTQLANENQPFATSGYTIFVAEVASTVNEFLFLDYLMDRVKDPVERVALLQHAIDDLDGAFYTQTMFAEFEWEAHKMVEMGQPVTTEALQDLYRQLATAQDGPAVVFDSLYRTTWARIGHFFESPFYVYQYATCYASAAQIHQDLRSSDPAVRESARQRHLTLLRSGGNDYPMEQLKRAGVDLSDPKAIRAVVTHLDYLVTQLEQELSNL